MPRDYQRLLSDFSSLDEDWQRVLEPIGFSDVPLAMRRLTGLTNDTQARRQLAQCMPMLLDVLSHVAAPDRSLLNFERFVQSVAEPLPLLQFLSEQPRAVEVLIKLFTSSQFLTDILLRNPTSLRQLTEHKRLAEFKAREEFREAAIESVADLITLSERLDALRRYQHWELLRVGACDTFGLMDFKSVTLQLSLLADGMTQAALQVLSQELHLPTDEFCVLAFGKLGGEELNFSSDIDLVFVCRGEASRYWTLGQKLIRALMDTTSEGFMYRVDMRLRPWGKSGALVCSLDSYLEYLQSSAQLWERQALLKARPIAGDLSLGRELLKRAEPLVFATPEDEARQNIRSMKGKIEAELMKRGKLDSDVKSGRGSIRDIEFLTQFLQLKYGRQLAAVRSANTLDGLIRLADFEFILPGEYRRLTAAYVLFRTIEHALQLMHNEQEHALPHDPRELAYLAGRLDFPNAAAFQTAYQQHRQDVRRIYERYIEAIEVPEADAEPTSKLPPHTNLMEPSYARVFQAEQIERHAVLLSRLSPDHPIEVEVMPALGDRIQLTVCGFDQKGDLSMMCGLLLAYGFDIVLANVFTAEQLSTVSTTDASSRRKAAGRKSGTEAKRFVNVFVLRPASGIPVATTTTSKAVGWPRFQQELAELVSLAARGQLREAQGRVASRVAATLRLTSHAAASLLPINIELDNSQSDRCTVLHISAEDTPGFLYELTNALSLVGFDIQRVIATSLGNRAVDIVHIVDPRGQRVTDPHEQARLRAAIAFIKHFTQLLPQSPNPEAALLHFGQFVERLFDQPDWASQLASLDHSSVLVALSKLLGVSDFLWEDFLRLQYDNLIPVLSDVAGLDVRKSRADLSQELHRLLESVEFQASAARRDVINAFKDREMFRVDLRHIMGRISDFAEFSQELTDIAEAVVDGVLNECLRYLADKHGLWMASPTDGHPQAIVPRIAVFALGKFGGRELGFASDIELMFVFDPVAWTSSPCLFSAMSEGINATRACPSGSSASALLQQQGSKQNASEAEQNAEGTDWKSMLRPGVGITPTEFAIKLVEEFSNSIRARRQGIFEIDLRLRPYGSAGPLAVSTEAFTQYFAPTGPAWPYERQALVKLRAVAGDPELGREIIECRDRFIYSGQPFDVASMRAMRERQQRQLVEDDTFNVKLGAGGLVDCEYLIQGLQITSGHEHPELRTPNTTAAMDALLTIGRLTANEHAELRSAYALLRRVIDALRMVRGDARDLNLPGTSSPQFRSLALRLGYESNWAQLREDLDQATTRISSLCRMLDVVNPSAR